MPNQYDSPLTIPLTLHTDARFVVNRQNQLGSPLVFDDTDQVCLVVDLKNNPTEIPGLAIGSLCFLSAVSAIVLSLTACARSCNDDISHKSQTMHA